uniref:Uncharacterized protein n=1 Tax=Arundo donax TaxID=35708 RepID=A0A0A9J2P0_ARUDO
MNQSRAQGAAQRLQPRQSQDLGVKEQYPKGRLGMLQLME